MKKRYWYGVVLLSSVLLLLLTGCSTQSPPPSTSAQTKLTVAAAANLSNAFKEIGPNFEKISNSKVDFTFGSTGTLVQQIENGAPFDVFASADVSSVEKLKDKGNIIPDTQQLYAQGRIGLATSTKNSLQVNELKDLLNPEIKKIAIANPDTAPYGMAARQALEKAGLWEQVKDKMVYGKNISETLTFIQTGNAEAGIIAQSLVKKEEIRFTPIDTNLYAPLNQAIAVVKGTSQEVLARKFIQYVNSPEGQQVLKKYGFAPPAEEKK